MNYLKQRPKRKARGKEKERPSQPLSSGTAAIKTPRDPWPFSPSSTHFASPTIATPEISHEYRNIWPLRGYFLLFAWLLRSLSDTTKNTHVLRFPIRMVLKYGTDVQLSEASTLRFLAKNSSIPVPKVYCSFARGNMRYIMMEYVKGQENSRKCTKISPEEKETL